MIGVYRCTCGWEYAVKERVASVTPASTPCGKCAGVAVFFSSPRGGEATPPAAPPIPPASSPLEERVLALERAVVELIAVSNRQQKLLQEIVGVEP